MTTNINQIFETSTETLSSLTLNQDFYYIPPYQRQYSWSEEDVQRLFESIATAFIELGQDAESFTFLGTIITIKDRSFKSIPAVDRPNLPASVQLVIDGQQRLTTLFILILALHERLRQSYEKVKNLEDSEKTDLIKAYTDLVAVTMNQIGEILVSYQFAGVDRRIPYMRIVRAFDDTWSRDEKQNKYESPIANLIYEYAITLQSFDLNRPQRIFNPRSYPTGSEKGVCRSRFIEIRKMLSDVRSIGIGETQISFKEPDYFLKNSKIAEDLLNPFGLENLRALSELNGEDDFKDGIVDLMLTRFVLQRVILTEVSVSKEEYAFAVFDSLNTTGKPLAPFEMFKPLVVDSVGLINYQSSNERKLVDDIATSLGNLDKPANLTDAEKITVSFALSENAHRLSMKRVPQRNFFRRSFKRAEKDGERLGYLQNFKSITAFHKAVFVATATPNLPGVANSQVSEECLTCINFLAKSKHTLVIPILARYWSMVEAASDNAQKLHAIAEFEKATRGITAFTTLFRATATDTAGIDQIYRDIMSGASSPTSLGPLHRSGFTYFEKDVKANMHPLSASALIADLHARLTDPANRRHIINKDDFVAKARRIPIYEVSQPIARFLLFIAMHDNVPDTATPGLLVKGLNGSNDLLNTRTWLSEVGISVEHVAPQNRTNDSQWDRAIYDDSLVSTIGNLTLCPSVINSHLSNAPWTRKRAVYKAFGSASGLADALRILSNEIPPFEKLVKAINENEVTDGDFVACKFFGNIGDIASDWDKPYVESRSENLLEFVWDRLITWLQ